MKIHESFDNFGCIKNPVVTTGSFDGVHIGHKTIINRLNNLAGNIDGESVLITFHPHPRKVLYPEKSKNLKLINTQREKKKLLAKTGLDHLFIIPFDVEFSKITSHQFVHDILIGKLGAKIIVVGFNHHFGHNREGDYEYLYKLSKKHNFKVEEIPQQDIENEAVSSTRIRKALTEGHIQRANASLDNLFFFSGMLTNHQSLQDHAPHSLFKLNIEEDIKIIPPEGIYAASTNINEQETRAMVIINKGTELQNHVYVHFMDKTTGVGKNLCHITLHKKIRKGLGDGDKGFKQIIEADKHKINELIY
ncbi:MAG: riboflavin kinase [Bacteroidota bacterium]